MARRRSTNSIVKTLILGCVLLCVPIVVVALHAGPAQAAANASGWNIVTSPSANPSANELLLSTTCANVLECWGVGATVPNGGNYAPLIEAWKGSSWTVSPSPAPPGSDGYALFGVTCATATDCWAVGAELGPAGTAIVGDLTENWDGAAWSVVPSPIPTGAVGGVLEGVSCASVSDCWAVGFTTDQNSRALRSLAEHWDGSDWTIVTSPATDQAFDQLNSVSCVGSENCWAVGSAGPEQIHPNFLPIYPAAAGDQGLIEHWDGSAWSVVPSFSPTAPDGGYLSAVTCVASSNCWASGSITNGSGSAGSTLTENWNGSVWAIIPSPDAPGPGGDIFSGITCLGASRCWAVGSSGVSGNGGGGFNPRSFIEYWDGTAWSIQPSPNVTSVSLLGSVTCVGGVSCWAVGGADTSAQPGSTVYQTLIEQLVLPASSNQGLLMVASDGGIFAFGDAAFDGSMGGRHLDAPVVGMAATPDGGGYWEVASDGGIFAFGRAAYAGSVPGQAITSAVMIVGISPAPDSEGYWLAGSDGSTYSYGDATFLGSLTGDRLAAPVVGVAGR